MDVVFQVAPKPDILNGFGPQTSKTDNSFERVLNDAVKDENPFVGQGNSGVDDEMSPKEPDAPQDVPDGRSDDEHQGSEEPPPMSPWGVPILNLVTPDNLSAVTQNSSSNNGKVDINSINPTPPIQNVQTNPNNSIVIEVIPSNDSNVPPDVMEMPQAVPVTSGQAEMNALIEQMSSVTDQTDASKLNINVLTDTQDMHPAVNPNGNNAAQIENQNGVVENSDAVKLISTLVPSEDIRSVTVNSGKSDKSAEVISGVTQTDVIRNNRPVENTQDINQSKNTVNQINDDSLNTVNNVSLNNKNITEVSATDINNLNNLADIQNTTGLEEPIVNTVDGVNTEAANVEIDTTLLSPAGKADTNSEGQFNSDNTPNQSDGGAKENSISGNPENQRVSGESAARTQAPAVSTSAAVDTAVKNVENLTVSEPSETQDKMLLTETTKAVSNSEQAAVTTPDIRNDIQPGAVKTEKTEVTTIKTGQDGNVNRITELSARRSVIDQVSRYITLNYKADEDRIISIQLDPAELGSIELTVRSKGRVVTAEATAAQEWVRNALVSSADQLKDSMSAKGLNLTSFDVNQNQQQENQQHHNPSAWSGRNHASHSSGSLNKPAMTIRNHSVAHDGRMNRLV